MKLLLTCIIIFGLVSCIEKPATISNKTTPTQKKQTTSSVKSINTGVKSTMQGQAVCHINKIGNQLADQNYLEIEAIQGKLFVTGWASDSKLRTPEKVSILLNGEEKTIAKIGNESQAQVPNYLADKLNLKDKIGFSKWMPITPGTYQLSIRVHEKGGNSYDSDQTIKIKVT